MKTKRQSILIIAFTLILGTLGSCEVDNTAESETIYEIEAIDKDEVRSPDDRGED